VVSIEDVERVELLYANGQEVKAIYQCRELALTALPGHSAKMKALLEKQTHKHPSDEYYFERFVYQRQSPEDRNAAEAVIWCSKWLYGQPDTHTNHNFRDKTSQRYVVQTRADFANNAFIALRRMATATTAVPKTGYAESRQREQEKVILAAIADLGYQASKIPVRKPGKPGAKAAVRAKLATNKMFQGTVFDKAWERLRKAEEIQDAAK